MSKNYSGLGVEHHIVNVRKYGMVVQLDDGSQWDIPPGDSTLAACWYATQRVVVEESENNPYPYKLTNLDTSTPDVVKANLR
jgi:hypothetical protein